MTLNILYHYFWNSTNTKTRDKKVVTGVTLASDMPPHIGESGFCNPGNFCCGIRNPGDLSCEIGNPGLWNPEYSSRNPERFESGLQLSLRKNLKSSTWNAESTVWNPESKTVMDSVSYMKRNLSFIYERQLYIRIVYLSPEESLWLPLNHEC